MAIWTKHPLLARFREDPSLQLSYSESSRVQDMNALATAVREQQNQIRELQWCLAAVLDCLEDRHMLRLVHGQPPRDRHDEQADVRP